MDEIPRIQNVFELFELIPLKQEKGTGYFATQFRTSISFCAPREFIYTLDPRPRVPRSIVLPFAVPFLRPYGTRHARSA